MTFNDRVEAMMSLSHNNMQLGKLVELVNKLFNYVPAQASAPLYCEWSEAYRAALQDMQKAYDLGVTEERTKCVAMMSKIHDNNKTTNQ
jgi:hypothetical protein